MLSIRPSWWKTFWMSLGSTSRMGSCPPTDKPPYLRTEDFHSHHSSSHQHVFNTFPKNGGKKTKKTLNKEIKLLPLFIHPVLALQTVKRNVVFIKENDHYYLLFAFLFLALCFFFCLKPFLLLISFRTYFPALWGFLTHLYFFFKSTWFYLLSTAYNYIQTHLVLIRLG